MITQEDQIKLKDFFNFVSATQSLSLIILHKIAEFDKTAKEVVMLLDKPKADFEINEDTQPEDFVKVLRDAFSAQKWLFLKIKTPYLPGPIYQQLRLLSTINRIDPQMSGDFIEKPKAVGLVALWTNENLENCPLPNMLDLFGGVYRVY